MPSCCPSELQLATSWRKCAKTLKLNNPDPTVYYDNLSIRNGIILFHTSLHTISDFSEQKPTLFFEIRFFSKICNSALQNRVYILKDQFVFEVYDERQ